MASYDNFGMTIGSVGQYPVIPDYIENVWFEDVKCYNCMEGAFIKTWQTEPAGGDDNLNGDAEGGGSGLIKNVTWRNFENDECRIANPDFGNLSILRPNGKNKNTSKMAIEDITWSDLKATTR